MLGLLVCLFVVSTTVAAEEYADQMPDMWLLDSPVPMERSLRSLTKLKERSMGQQRDGHFPYYRGLGRK